MTGSSPPTRETGVTNTATASWTNFTLVEISDDAEQLKNVFLYRTGDYVAYNAADLSMEHESHSQHWQAAHVQRKLTMDPGYCS